MFKSNNPSQPLLFAHRGSRLLAPENTSIAFDLALSHGCHVLEIDVRVSRDQQVIVTHDGTVDRTSNGTGRVADLSLAGLKKLDAAYRFSDISGKHYRGMGANFMTLTELSQAYPDTPINIDIKDNDVGAARLVAELISSNDMADRVNVGSFHSQVIKAFRQFAPTVSTAANQQEVARLYTRFWLRQSAQPKTQPHFKVLQIPRFYRGLPLATRNFIDYLHKQQLPVMYWTVNDPSVMRRLLQSGANGIVTDRTDLAKQVFFEHGLKFGTNATLSAQSNINNSNVGENHDAPK